MTVLKYLFGLITLMPLVFSMAVADTTREVSEVIEADGIEQLDVTLDFGAGSLFVRSGDIDDAAEIDVYYTPKWVDYDIDFKKKGNTGHLRLGSELLRSHKSSDEMENEWRLTLSRKLTTTLDLDFGACEAELDLGGIPLVELTMDIGAASAMIEFSEPNPIRMKELNIDVGASSLELDDLANANADYIKCAAGAASCELDFRGDFKGETELDIDVGVGGVDIILPLGLAVRVEGDDGWFSTIDFHGLDLRERRGDVWESDDFDDAEDRIIITCDVGMGSIDITAKR